MPRIARKDINTKYLHIMLQGIEKRDIFKKAKYKYYYMKLLKTNLKIYSNINILAYCVMDNHIHLLIYCEDIGSLSKLMNKVNTAYALWYNKIQNRVGYVFRNRYTVQTIKNKQHLLNCLVYIHNNPVKANIVQNMKDYDFSSYNLYKNQKIEKKIIKLVFQSENYINQFNFIHETINYNKFKDIIDEEEKTDEKIILNIIDNFCKNRNLSLEIIRKSNMILLELVDKLKRQTNINNKEISEYLGIGKNRIKNIIKRG